MVGENCKNCVNAIFDETWGEYKCKAMEITIYRPENYEDCPKYKPKSSKK